MGLIKRYDIIKILEEWLNGNISEVEVLKWANEKHNKVLEDLLDFNDYIDDNYSATKEVLLYLDSMNMNLVIKEDIPQAVDFLNSSNPDFKKSFRAWNQYLKNIDYRKRKLKLKNIPFYSEYCK